jgi:rRNA processing protein Gar1
MLQSLCTPALIYLLFSATQITIDLFKRDYNVALVKFTVAFIFTILLNYLCSSGLGIVSWIIVFIPFILMSVIVSYILTFFGIDPKTKKIRILQDGEVLKTEKEKKEEEKENIQLPSLSNINASYSEGENKIVINYTSNKDGSVWCKAIKKGGSKPTIFQLKEQQSQPMFKGDENQCSISDYLDDEEYVVYIYAEDNQTMGMTEEDMLATGKYVITQTSSSANSSTQGFQTIKQSFSNFFSGNSPVYNERKQHINHVEKILNNLNESDNAAYFIVQAETCANKKTNNEYEKCLKRVIQEVYSRIKNTETKQNFLSKLHNSKINITGIDSLLI